MGSGSTLNATPLRTWLHLQFRRTDRKRADLAARPRREVALAGLNARRVRKRAGLERQRPTAEYLAGGWERGGWPPASPETTASNKQSHVYANIIESRHLILVIQ